MTKTITYEVEACPELGSKRWYFNGELHREDGPAIEWADGSKHWFLNGKRHREGGPAVEDSDGTKHWFLNGKLHSEVGPATEWPDGKREWFLNDKRYNSFEDYLQGLRLLGKEEAVINLLFNLDKA